MDLTVVSLMNDFHVRETTLGECSQDIHCPCALNVLRLITTVLHKSIEGILQGAGGMFWKFPSKTKHEDNYND